MCYPPHRGRLLTRYSPVRHYQRTEDRRQMTDGPKFRRPFPLSPLFHPLTVRLECVKHAASVHPEPGSNSPSFLYYIAGSARNCATTNSCLPVYSLLLFLADDLSSSSAVLPQARVAPFPLLSSVLCPPSSARCVFF